MILGETKRLGVLTFVVLLLTHTTVLVLPANIDFSQLSAALHMDERIYFVQIAKILNTNHISEFVPNLIGTDFRYGRLTYWLPAFFAAPLYPFLGDAAIILSARFVSYFALVLIALFCFINGRKTLTAAFGSTLILCLPYSDYYATVPKPDPLQVLLIVLAIHYAVRNSWKLACLLAGMAVGLKISGILALTVILWISLQYVNVQRDRIYFGRKRILLFCLSCSFWLLAGFVFCVPILLLGRQGWDIYLLSTISQISHGSDLAGPPLMNWLSNIRNILGGTIEYLSLLSIIVVGCILVLFEMLHKPLAAPIWANGISGYNLFFGGVKKLFFQKQNAGIVMFLFGVIWCFSIILNVPRMWGFYLWPGLTLLVYGFVLTVSNDVNELPFPTRRLLNIFALSIACLFYVNFLIDGTSHYKNFQKRSSSPQHFVQIARMDAVIEFVESFTAEKGSSLVHLDPRLYQPALKSM